MIAYIFSKKRAENNDLDDGSGNGISLDEHMDYINSGGTPDCIDIIEGSFTDIAEKMANSFNDVIFVDENGDILD